MGKTNGAYCTYVYGTPVSANQDIFLKLNRWREMIEVEITFAIRFEVNQEGGNATNYKYFM